MKVQSFAKYTIHPQKCSQVFFKNPKWRKFDKFGHTGPGVAQDRILWGLSSYLDRKLATFYVFHVNVRRDMGKSKKKKSYREIFWSYEYLLTLFWELLSRHMILVGNLHI